MEANYYADWYKATSVTIGEDEFKSCYTVNYDGNSSSLSDWVKENKPRILDLNLMLDSNENAAATREG